MVVGAFSCVFYVVGIPVLAFGLLFKRRRQLYVSDILCFQWLLHDRQRGLCLIAGCHCISALRISGKTLSLLKSNHTHRTIPWSCLLLFNSTLVMTLHAACGGGSSCLWFEKLVILPPLPPFPMLWLRLVLLCPWVNTEKPNALLGSVICAYIGGISVFGGTYHAGSV